MSYFLYTLLLLLRAGKIKHLKISDVGFYKPTGYILFSILLLRQMFTLRFRLYDLDKKKCSPFLIKNCDLKP